MIRLIRVKNWLSYEEASIENLDESRVIAVVGENGSGKSALLEAVPYALYGLSRSTAGDMTRIGSEEHSVEVEIVGNFAGGSNDVLSVLRGRDKNGKGFSQVRINGVIQSKGGESTDNVADILGMDAAEFMLTAFFGLGGSSKQDTLLSVTPSQRLETLQRIAGVEIYKRFQDRTKERIKSLERELELGERELETLNGTFEDPNDIQKEIEDMSSELERLRREHEETVGERNERVTEMDRFTALVRERDGLSADIRNSSKQLSDIEGELVDAESRIEELRRDIETLVKRRDSFVEEIEEARKVKTRNSETIQSEIASRSTVKKIKSLGVKEASSSCPLCGSEVSEGTVKQWLKDIGELEKEIEGLESESLEVRAVKAAMESLQQKHTKAANALREKMRDVESLEKQIEKLKKKDRSLRGDEEALRTRRDKLEREIGENYDQLSQKIKNLTATIEDLREQIGSYESEIKLSRENKTEMAKVQRRIVDLGKTLREGREHLHDLERLGKGFSRYGIPMQLLAGLRDLIEEKATQIYREFDNGFIRIEDTEGARPGVDFVLMDQKGRRPYKLLSQGESAMFYLAVRVAVGEAVAETGGGVDFLILDELTANLSPNRRDDLVRVIGKVLRLRYPQIAMVSHASMREVFDREIAVEVRNGVSLAESKGR